jgi:hypothetical protein
VSARLTLLFTAAAMILALATGLYWKGRHDGAVQERPKTAAALMQAKVSGLEAQGAEASVARVGAATRRRDAANAVVARLIPQALKSEDANAPLDPGRVARLRTADEQLCLAAPGLAGCAAHRDAR